MRCRRPALDRLHGERRVRGDALREPERGGQQLVVRNHPTHEADAQRLGGVDDLAGHQHLGGLLTTDQLRETTEPGRIAHEPAQHEQLAEPRLLGRDSEVGHERQLHAPPDRRAVDRGDHRDVGVQQRVRRRREPGRARQRAADVGRSLASAHHHLDVVAGAERRVGAGDDEATSGRGAHGILELGVGLERQRVARLGAPQRDHTDVALLFVGEVFVHRSPS